MATIRRLLLVRGELRQVQRNLRLARRNHRLHDLAVDLGLVLLLRWPIVLSNAVDPGLVRTKMGGPTAPVEIETGQRTQAWLAASEDRPPYQWPVLASPPAGAAGGRRSNRDPEFQDQLIV